VISLRPVLTEDGLEAAVLHKFNVKGAWGEYHIYESDVPKGFPPNARKGIMKAAERLKKKGLLRSWPHGREHVWTLNKDRSAEIVEILKKSYPEFYK
jgi:hypothetical protein